MVSCPASSRVISSSRIRFCRTVGSRSSAVASMRRESTSSRVPSKAGCCSAPGRRAATMRFSSRARPAEPQLQEAVPGWHRAQAHHLEEGLVLDDFEGLADGLVRAQVRVQQRAAERPRVSPVISCRMSTVPAPADSLSRSASSSASSPMVPICRLIRRGWSTGWITLRWARHSGPSLVSRPSPSARRACTRPMPCVVVGAVVGQHPADVVGVVEEVQGLGAERQPCRVPIGGRRLGHHCQPVGGHPCQQHRGGARDGPGGRRGRPPLGRAGPAPSPRRSCPRLGGVAETRSAISRRHISYAVSRPSTTGSGRVREQTSVACCGVIPQSSRAAISVCGVSSPDSTRVVEAKAMPWASCGR